jgi:hypothetical protein
VPAEIAPAAVFFALALIFDALQYFIAARKWRKQVDVADAQCESDDDDCSVPVKINVAPRRFLAAKLSCVLLGYAWLVGGLGYLIATGKLQ